MSAFARTQPWVNNRRASEWLIRPFIDPESRSDPVSTYTTLSDAVAFDSHDVGVRHDGDRCTFEVLVRRFELKDAVLRRIAEDVQAFEAPCRPLSSVQQTLSSTTAAARRGRARPA